MERVHATEAARRFSDLLSRVQYTDASFLIVRNGEEIALLSRPASGVAPSVRDFLSHLRAMKRPDKAWASDLEAIQAEQPRLPEDSWPSS